MKLHRLASICLFLIPAAGAAADPGPAKPTATTLTFYVAGVECPACVFSVNDSVRRLDGVEEVIDGQNNANFINVTFDPEKVSAHQIAQAVTDAFPLHGAPYVATMRLVVPGYGEGGNAEKVAAVFAKWKDWIDLEAAKPGKGELVVRFHPLANGDEKASVRGWDHVALSAALAQALPSGTKVTWMSEK